MPDYPLKLRKLTRILRRYDVQRDDSRGKGSHVLFWKQFEDGKRSFPLPGKKNVAKHYVTAARRRFSLTPDDGVSDTKISTIDGLVVSLCGRREPPQLPAKLNTPWSVLW